MSATLYDTLGVSKESSAKEIKRAYFQAVKRNPPEKNPERFKAIREAYETLSNDASRRDYDALQEHGDEIAKLQQQAEAAMEAENWKVAQRQLKHILVLWPAATAARRMLAVTHLHMEQWSKAFKLLDKLVADHPGVGYHWQSYGDACIAAAGAQANDRKKKLHRDKARQCWSKVIELEPYNAEPYLDMARSLAVCGEFTEAKRWAEKAIQADGVVDIDDTFAFNTLCEIAIAENKPHEVHAIVDRLRAVIPDDPDAREFVASRFAHSAARLADESHFAAAAAMAKACDRIAPDSDRFDDLVSGIRDTHETLEQGGNLLEDSNICDPVQELCRFLLQRYMGYHKENAPPTNFDSWDEVGEAIFRYLNDVPAREVRDSLKRVRSRYPQVFEIAPDMLSRVQREADQISSDEHVYSGHSTGGSSGDCFVVTATYGSVDAPLVQWFRFVRDTRLVRHTWGRALIRCYNVVGPVVAQWVRRSEILRRLSRRALRVLARWTGYTGE